MATVGEKSQKKVLLLVVFDYCLEGYFICDRRLSLDATYFIFIVCLVPKPLRSLFA